MKSHFTKFLNDIFFKLNIKLSKIDTDIQIIKKLNSIKNLNSRLIAADKELKKNLHNPEIYLIIATCHHYLANIEKFEYFSLYNI